MNKTISKLIEEIGCYEVVEITFKAHGQRIKRKGYDLRMHSVNPLINSSFVAVTFEPVFYSNGDKWLIYGHLIRRYMHGVIYAKNVCDARKKILKLLNS